MGIDFYYMPISAGCRAIQVVAKEVGVELNLRPTNLMKGEQLVPEFIAINPQHTIPTIHDTDSGYALWETRAILAYLVNKYAPGSDLYPTDAEARGTVDQRLHFDLGSLYPAMGKILRPMLFGGEQVEEDIKALNDKLAFLELFLDGHTYVAGDSLTIADIVLQATVGQLKAINFDVSAYPNIVAWVEKVDTDVPLAKQLLDEAIAMVPAMIEAKKAAEAAAQA